MSKQAWKAIAVGEFIIISAAISFIIFYFAYKTGLLNEGSKGVLQVIANIAYLVFFFAGTSGWMLLIGLWKGVD